MTDLISVIVPVYRVEKYIEQCIDSIRNQTYQNLEIILVDDGSDDGCPQICDMYARKDQRVKVIHQPNGGTNSARKAGMRIATGKYVGYVDGDDWIEPEMYEKLYEHAVESGCSIVESGVIDSWNEKYVKRFPRICEGKYTEQNFKKYVEPFFIYTGTFYENGLFPYLVTKLFRKTCIEHFQLSNDDSFNIMDDVLCTYPAVEAAESIYITYECFYHYRVREDSTKRIVRTNIMQMTRENYKNWIGKFIGQPARDQMKFLILYLLISKEPWAFDEPESNTYLEIYGNIKKKNRIVLYGAGVVGITLYHYIVNIAKGSLVLWVDRNYRKLGESLPVVSPENIPGCDFDYIIIGVMQYSAVESIRKDLELMGVQKDKIVWLEQTYLETPDLLIKNRGEA